MLHGDHVHSGSLPVGILVPGVCGLAFDLRMQSMVLRSVDVHAGMPFVATLLQDDVVGEDRGAVSPLLETEASTGGILLVLGRTRHHFRGEGAERCVKETAQLPLLLQHFIINYSH